MMLSCGENKIDPNQEQNQEQNQEEEPMAQSGQDSYVFTINPTETEAPAVGGNLIVTVTCTGGYHVNSMPGWVKQMQEKSGRFVFRVEANTTGAVRSGVIVFCDDVATCLPCIVRQAAE